MINKIQLLLLLPFTLLSCEEEDAEFGPISVPSNIEVTATIAGVDAENPNGDGSGVVTFKATAENAIAYQYSYNGEVIASPSGETTYNFGTTGLNTYTVTVIAVGTGGITSSKTVSVEVLVSYEPPADLLQMLVNGGSRTWRIKAEANAHFGLGPVGGAIPAEWYAAGAFEKSATGMYDDRYIFNQDGTFTHITNSTNDNPVENTEGTVFGRVNLIDELGTHNETPNGADIENYPYSDYTAQWSLSAPDGNETLTLSGKAFLGYYTGGNHRYQIFSRSEDEMLLRTTDGNNEFDWWFIVTAAEEDTETEGEAFENLIWSEEFDTNGAPDPSAWNYELGDGCPDLCGWGNNEAQYYTDTASNVRVENGVLKITAMAESLGGREYTSARITTQDKFEFTYGRVEISAKLPEGRGTWPALWMLGADFESNPWPAAGEVDIMEHVGNNPNTILATTHDPNNFGGNGRTGSTTITGASTDFHTYSLEWTETELRFYVDGTQFHSVSNRADLPFNKDFFLIMNIAMGGNLGGSIDPAFVSSTMEIDYIRVYQ